MVESSAKASTRLAARSETSLGKATAILNCYYMKPINLDRINAIVPYKVETDGKQFSFVTRHGLHYEIRFFEEQPMPQLKDKDSTQPSLLKTEIHY